MMPEHVIAIRTSTGRPRPGRRAAAGARQHRQLRRRPPRPSALLARTRGAGEAGRRAGRGADLRPASAPAASPRAVSAGADHRGRPGPPARSSSVDQVVVLRTTPDLLPLTAEEFFAQVVHGQLAGAGAGRGLQLPLRPRPRGHGGDAGGAVPATAGIAFEVVPPLEHRGHAGLQQPGARRPAARRRAPGRRPAGPALPPARRGSAPASGAAGRSAFRPPTWSSVAVADSRRRRLCRAGRLAGRALARGRQHRPQPDLRRAGPQGRGPPDRLPGRPVRPGAARSRSSIASATRGRSPAWTSWSSSCGATSSRRSNAERRNDER